MYSLQQHYCNNTIPIATSHCHSSNNDADDVNHNDVVPQSQPQPQPQPQPQVESQPHNNIHNASPHLNYDHALTPTKSQHKLHNHGLSTTATRTTTTTNHNYTTPTQPPTIPTTTTTTTMMPYN